LGSKLIDHLWRQFDFEWNGRLERGHQRFSLLCIAALASLWIGEDLRGLDATL
jgi:hypothetical protein